MFRESCAANSSPAKTHVVCCPANHSVPPGREPGLYLDSPARRQLVASVSNDLPQLRVSGFFFGPNILLSHLADQLVQACSLRAVAHCHLLDAMKLEQVGHFDVDV